MGHGHWRIVAVVASLSLAAPGRAGDGSWVGKVVVVKKPGNRIGHTDEKGKPVYVATLTNFEYRVLAEKGGWIKVRHKGVEGWFAKDDAVPLERAVDYFTRRIKDDPNDAVAFLHRGVVRRLRGEVDAAIKDLGEAVRLKPSATAFNSRGIAWRTKGEYDKAIQDYGDAIRLDASYAPAFNNRGNAWRAKKEYAKAVQDYGEAIRLEPKDASALNNQAWLLATCPDEKYRDGKNAVELARRACELTAWKDLNYFDTLAAACAEAGQFEEAVRWQEKVLAEPAFVRGSGEAARRRLELYQNKKPYHEE
jgi:tetratricopeptide (TPR) repeat protein